jgi:hypothetical protein
MVADGGNYIVLASVLSISSASFEWLAQTLPARIGELSVAVYPKRKQRISAYCFRHRIVADLKRYGTGRETITQALSHLSDYSSFRYGRPSSGKGSGDSSPALKAEAARKVKRNPKTDRLSHFKTKMRSKKFRNKFFFM